MATSGVTLDPSELMLYPDPGDGRAYTATVVNGRVEYTKKEGQ